MKRTFRIALQILLAVSLILFVFGETFVTSTFVRGRNTQNDIEQQVKSLSVDDLGDRVLVFAPHPDDESLAAGGLIWMAKEQGKQVKVVIMTNGDCFTRGVEAYLYQIKPKPQTYLQYGEQRQLETITSLTSLGIAQSDVIFLGFPDKGLAKLWQGVWGDVPYRSSCTGYTQVPYDHSFKPGAPFTAPELISLIKTVILSYMPTSVLVTDSSDANSDHWATSNFVMTALLQMESFDKAYSPKVFTYVIHSGYWQTMPASKHLKEVLYPPKYFLVEGYRWYSLALSQTAKQMKVKAISNYHTQETVMPQFLQNFERPNELFNLYVVRRIPKVEAAVTDEDLFRGLLTLEPVCYSPQSNKAVLVLNSGAYLNRLYALTTKDESMVLGVQLGGRARVGTRFLVRVKFFGAEELISSYDTWASVTTNGLSISNTDSLQATASMSKDLFALVLKGKPAHSIFVGISVQSYYEGVQVDSLPWHFLSF
ncbi:MAG TPA: PIG-L family deacetylase [Coprothermobacter sp.]|nr:PIG-L family deacetylase [Coprothermobacter sp.]